MTALSIESTPSAQAAAVAAMLHGELLRGLARYTFNVDALSLEHALEAVMGTDDLAHLQKARRLVETLQDHLRSQAAGSTSSHAALTRREIEVLDRVADGLCTADIATSLHISRNTVRNHVQNILAKLSVHTRLQAVTLAIDFGLIQPASGSLARRHSGVGTTMPQ